MEHIMATDSPNFLTSASDRLKSYNAGLHNDYLSIYKADHPGFDDEMYQVDKEYQEKFPDFAPPAFELIGRKDVMTDVSKALLTKSKKNNVVMTGQSGIGLSTIILGLEAGKADPSTPMDMVEKNFFYLDVDALFSLDSDQEIKDGFNKAMDTLTRLTDLGKDVVLVIEDTKDFLDGVTENHVNNIISKLMEATNSNPHFQTIFAATDQELPALYQSHKGFRKKFQLQDVGEPPKDELRAIVEAAAKNLGMQYGVTISQEAINSALAMPEKIPLPDLPAQPTLSLTILEGAITSHLLTAQAKPPGLDALKKDLDIVTIALATKTPAEGEFANRTEDELEGIRKDRDATITRLEAEWKVKQDEIALLYKSVKRDMDGIRQDSDKIAAEIAAEEKRRVLKKEADEQFRAVRNELRAAKAKETDSDADKETQLRLQATLNDIRRNYEMNTSKNYAEPSETPDPEADAVTNLSAKLSGFSSGEIKDLEKHRKIYVDDLIEKRAEYKALTTNPDGTPLELTEDDVLAEFSRLSKVPMNKLQEDETEKLLSLAARMKEFIFGQDGAVDMLANAVIRAKAGIKPPNKPIGSFLFLGPSGTGKTETAKVLARLLFGDESAMVTFNMENYKDKTSINTLLGSPQGLVGYEEGGKLVNTVRKRPYSVLLFDELEKAYPDIRDVFLSMCDEGVVEDTRGLKAYFGNIVNIMTSNFGAEFLLDEDIDFEDAKEMAEHKLRTARDPQTGELVFKAEFLNRVTIVCYNRLGEPEIIRIADKDINEINEQAADKGISVDMPEAEVIKMIKQQYDPFQGGRGIGKYIEDTIGTFVSETIFRHRNVPGVVKIGYTPGDLDEAARDKIKAKVEREMRAKLKAQFADASSGQTLDLDETDQKAAEEIIKAKTVIAEKNSAQISAEFTPADAAKPTAKPAAQLAANDTGVPAAARASLVNS